MDGLKVGEPVGFRVGRTDGRPVVGEIVGIDEDE